MTHGFWLTVGVVLIVLFYTVVVPFLLSSGVTFLMFVGLLVLFVPIGILAVELYKGAKK